MSVEVAIGENSEASLVGFAQKVLLILDEGRKVSTYKYAVLLGLIDLCLECTTEKGAAPTSLTVKQLAVKFVEMYWRQARRYDRGEEVLRQNSGRQARMLTVIAAYRRAKPGVREIGIREVERSDPGGYAGLLAEAELILLGMPLPRLQTVGNLTDEFLYHLPYRDQGRGPRRSRGLQGPEFDNRIVFKGDAAERLVVLAPLLRPIIQREWAASVARLNRFEVDRLEGFLFGSERKPTKTLQAGLREIQDNRCFYCDGKLQRPEVDHFVPWARFADDGLDNLVLADNRCNGSKSAHLAANAHVERWSARFHADSVVARDLAALALRENWERDPSRTVGVARGLYLHLPGGSPLWQQPGAFEPVDPSRLAAALLPAG